MTPGVLWMGLACVAALECHISRSALVQIGWCLTMLLAAERMMAAMGAPW